MDAELARESAAKIWAHMIPFDSPYTQMDGKKERDIKAALAELERGLEGSDGTFRYHAECIRLALQTGIFANPEGKPNREAVLDSCEALQKLLSKEHGSSEEPYTVSGADTEIL